MTNGPGTANSSLATCYETPCSTAMAYLRALIILRYSGMGLWRGAIAVMFANSQSSNCTEASRGPAA